METYTVVEAKDRLSELIGRACEGEAVIITRNGRAPTDDAGTLPSKLRDEGVGSPVAAA